MAKMSLDDLRKLRDDKKNDLRKRDAEGKEIQIIVGMGTCGIAAGAKETLDAFITALDENKLVDTCLVRQTGCMGLCHSEPTVEVAVPGMPPGSPGMEVPGQAPQRFQVLAFDRAGRTTVFDSR